MGALIEQADALLASVVADMKTAAKVDVYTVPPGQKMMVTKVVIHSPTASLAGGTDYDLGTGVNADTWKQTVDLSSMTATDDYMVIDAAGTKYSIEAGGSVFGIKVITGSTAAANASVDLFGYLVAE